LAFISYAYYQIQNMDPVGLIGIMFFLEYLPTVAGSGIADRLRNNGIPEDAMKFIKEHAVVDIAHLKVAESYLRRLVKNEKHLNSVLYAIHVTAELYARLIEGAIENAERNPLQFGADEMELSELRISDTR